MGKLSELLVHLPSVGLDGRRFLVLASVVISILISLSNFLLLVTGSPLPTSPPSPSPSPSPSTDAVVSIPGLGKILGVVDSHAHRRYFRGVPYAEPPVGDLRWRNPVQVKPWGIATAAATTTKSKVYNATTFAPDCAQMGPGWTSLGDISTASEDCLYLNIYQPTDSKEDGPLPVMIYFPAGGFAYGAGKDLESDGLPALPDLDVMLVTVQYRLGVFGYMAHDNLRSRTPDNSTGHYGTRDQRAAMAWVKAHIAAFGGDPKAVTIFGESAGASTVTLHLSTPASFGLFERAAIESGAFNMWSAKPMSHAELQYGNFTMRLGCNHTNAANTMSCLLAKNTSEILSAADTYYGSNSYLPNWLVNGSVIWHYGDTTVETQWGPVIDGVELTDLPRRLMEAGKTAPNVDILMGSNGEEGSMLMPGLGLRIVDAASLRFWFANYFGQDAADALATLYAPRGSPPTHDPWHYWYRGAINAVGDYLLGCPTENAAQHLSAQGRTIYRYWFTHTPTYSINTPYPEHLGAFHGAEVPYVFYDTFEFRTPGEFWLSENMARYWTNFARTGNPNLHNLHNKNDFLDEMEKEEEEKEKDLKEGKRRRSEGNFSIKSKKMLSSASSSALPLWPAYNSSSIGANQVLDVWNITSINGLLARECTFWKKYHNPASPYKPDPHA